MELLEPELQKTYERCKYIVKVWEHQFKKKYKRIPSKLDIKEASRDVRNAYRRYFQLKTAIIDQSFKGVEGFEDESDNDLEDNSCVETQIYSDCNNACDDELELKSQVSEATNNKSDDVWGAHLNNKQVPDKQIAEKIETSNLNENITKKLFCGSKFSKRNPRKSLSQRNKNKSDSNHKIALPQPIPSFSSFSSDEAISILQNENSETFLNVPHSVGTLSHPVNVVQTFLNSKPRNLNTIDSGWLKRVAQVIGESQEFPDFISLNNDESHTESTKLDYDSDDVIENSDDEYSYKNIPSLHIAKKRKIEVAESSEKCKTNKQMEVKEDIVKNYVETKLMFEETKKMDSNGSVLNEKSEFQEDDNRKILQKGVVDNFNKNCIEEKTDKINQEIVLVHQENAMGESPSVDLEYNADIGASIINKKKHDQTTNQKKNKKKPKKKVGVEKTPKINASRKTPKKNLKVISPASQRRSSRKTKAKDLKDFSSSEEDAFHTDTDQNDPEFQLDNVKKKKNMYNFSSNEETEKNLNLTKKRKTTSSNKRGRKTKNSDDDLQNEENDGYDLEFSIKPRVVVSRYGSINSVFTENNILTNGKETDATNSDEVCKDKDKVKDKSQQAKEKLEQKIVSGSLNDNFVRINIKKKVFVRGKSGKNFSKFKKSQWKKAKALAGSDMYMGGCDGGFLTCFNCGQAGHFAQNCKSIKGDSLLKLNADDEEQCPFPTLEEASKMAQDGHLTVRKPKLVATDINFGNTNIVDNDDEVFTDDVDCEQLLLETIKLEEHIKKLDVKMYLDSVTVVEPYYKLNEDGRIIDTPSEVFDTLKKFGHTSFRPGQEQAIMRILSGKSTLVTLSTGSGKSLCYQLPAYLYSQREPCISLIISPLVSLMDDQVMGIAKFMKAGCLHSNQTTAQRKKILEAISMGELSILLVSPEAVVSGEKQQGFSSFLRKLPPIAFACIDEAHCVSQWSHNFRPSYLMICKVLRQSLGVKTILGLTATATKATQSSIIQHLQILDGEEGVIKDIPLPDNLQLSVSKDVNRDHALISLLLSDRFKDCKSIIIYCTRRLECERIAGFLRTSLKSEKPVEEGNKKRKRVNFQAEPYHAGMPASRRRTIQNAFMSGELRIVVATVAFGMGINKSDIRAVIHYNMPSSFESYVQEVGRAGRDGLEAQCHVFLDSKGGDENELRRHIHSNSIDHHVIRKLLTKIFISCSCKENCPKHEVAFSIESTVQALDIPEENISTLLCYLELHENSYIELLSPAYTKCRVVSYSGPLQIRKVAKECPPLAMALALHKNKEGNDPNVLEFPVVDVAAAMGWESGICKHKLKNLEWITVNNQPKRSPINVQFSDLGFRFLAPGNLLDEQLDEALENLYNRVVNQERTALLQLNAIHQALLQVAKPSFKACISDERDDLIKLKVREYFNAPEPLKLISEIVYPTINEEQLVADIHALISMYRDNNFTGRVIARIFQGIQSPNYPAVMWGRCKFWRSHLDKDFHKIAKIATREIVRLR